MEYRGARAGRQTTRFARRRERELFLLRAFVLSRSSGKINRLDDHVLRPVVLLLGGQGTSLCQPISPGKKRGRRSKDPAQFCEGSGRMLIIPAIDIRHGQCVRLYQGKEDQETVYWKDPVEMAGIWVKRGAKILHVADLDGAFQGKPANLEKVAAMKRLVTVPIQIGGGYRSMDAIEAAFAVGVDRVILGTAAVYNPDLVAEAIAKYG